MSLRLATLLGDERVRVLVAAGRHARTALTADISLRAQRRAAENLELALSAFETDEPPDTLSPIKAAALAGGGAT